MDVFFYGYGDKFRREWTAALVGEPSREAPFSTSRSAGGTSRGDTGLSREIGDVPFNVFARAISASRINLNITRRSHATRERVVDLPAVRAPPRRAPLHRLQPPHAGIKRRARAGQRARRGRDGRGGARPPTRSLLNDPDEAEAMAVERASACSTSTPTPPPCAADLASRSASSNRGGSACLSSAASRSCRPGTRRARSAGVLKELRAFVPGLDVVVVDDGSADPPRPSPGPRAPSSRCRSTSASAARCSGFQFARRRAATTAPSSSTPTASTTRTGSRPCSTALDDGADMAVGSRFASDSEYRLVARRRLGIRPSSRASSR